MNQVRITSRIKGKVWHMLNMRHRLRNWDDKRYLKLLYWVNLGTIPNLDQPVTFNEKLQWLKLHDRDPHYTTLVDKLAVKSWVTEQIGEDRVIPLLGAWDSFDDIDFNDLPAQFVLKCTHDSGGLVICQDIKNFDHEGARNIIEHSLSSNYFSLGREWPYRDVKPRVLAEVYFPGWRPDSHVAEREDTALDPGAGSTPTPPGSTEGVIDYKFYCFHGEPEFLYVSQGLHDHRTAKMVFLNPDWTPAGFRRLDYRDFDPLPPKPRRLEQMITIARQLSKNIPFVRVDLFEHEGHVLFSEMTFTPVSGMMPFDPPDADRAIGQLLDLSRVEKRR